MIKKSLTILLIMIFCFPIMQILHCSNSPYYFIGYSNLKPIRLKLDIGDDVAIVQYFGQKDKIKLTFLRHEELRQNQNYPSLYQVEWEEIYNNKKTGKYIMVYQGAVVYHFIYLRYSDQKVFAFEKDLDIW